MRLAISLLIVVTWAIPAKCQHGSTAKSGNTQSGKSEETQPTTPIVIFQDHVNTHEADGNRQQQTKNPADPPHNWRDTVNALSTVVIAIFTVFAAGFICWQVIITRRVERAWITVSIRHDTEMDSVINMLIHTDTANLECVLLNCGNTPARLTGFTVQNCVSESLHPVVKPDYGEYMELDKMILAPHDSIPMPIRIEEQTLKAYDAAKGKLYVYGVVHYLDAFDKPHSTNFCLLSPFLAGREAGMEIAFHRGGPAAYNRAS